MILLDNLCNSYLQLFSKRFTKNAKNPHHFSVCATFFPREYPGLGIIIGSSGHSYMVNI